MDPFVHTARISLGQGLTLILFASLIILSNKNASAQEKQPIVRIAKLQIDSAQIEKFKAALKEEIETSIRFEPGVVNLYAVEEKNRAGHVIIFEVYANEASYKSHLETPHFKRYKSTTNDMVKSLELVATNPIVLGARPGK